MLGAFQGALPEDGDHPTVIGGVVTGVRYAHGVTISGDGQGRSAMTFAETMLDRYAQSSNPSISSQEVAALVSLHELGNIWGLSQEAINGPLMPQPQYYIN